MAEYVGDQEDADGICILTTMTARTMCAAGLRKGLLVESLVRAPKFLFLIKVIVKRLMVDCYQLKKDIKTIEI